MTQFTPAQLDKIRSVVQDKYSIGAFSGMIFNASVSNPDRTIDSLIEEAIRVRLRLEELGQ